MVGFWGSRTNQGCGTPRFWVCFLLLVTAFLLGSCSGRIETIAQDGGAQVGALTLTLRIDPGFDLDELHYVLAGNGVTDSGNIDVSSESATASLFIGGLPAGSGYQITLTGTTTTGDIDCLGGAAFAITAGETTTVVVPVVCRGPSSTGNVIFDASIHDCPYFTAFSALPTAINVGDSIQLSAAATSPDNAHLDFTWSASAGVIAAPHETSTSLLCTEASQPSVTVTVTDGLCTKHESFQVTCSAAPGPCSHAADGTPCNDGNACTSADSCQGGQCVGSSPTVCAATDSCHLPGVCDPGTGACSSPVAPDGFLCNDGNACTQTDQCTAGICTGFNPVVCAASDSCHLVGTCAPSTGLCSNPIAPDGQACNDGNLCTQTDSCQSGSCFGANPVICSASDSCHLVGTCTASTGICSNPTAPDGQTCNDGNLCTQTDSCSAGICTGSNPVVCAPIECQASACTALGGCAYTALANGTACRAGTSLNPTDQCQSGACVDHSAPSFSGVTNSLVVDDHQITLSWGSASDNVTPQSALVYDICASTTSGSCQTSFTTAVTTTAGNGLWNIGNLLANTTYYFVVRARDQAGNRDTNSIQVSGRTAVPSVAHAIAGGDAHSCSVSTSGSVRCWGQNDTGAVGDGTMVDRLTPTLVSALSGATGVATGKGFSCALLSDGTGRCWGLNSTGQLGNNGTSNRTFAATVTGLAGAVALTAGDSHACALLSDGTARCWGNNTNGQIGDGTFNIRRTPVAVSGLTNAIALAAGGSHTCALLNDGTVRCWGRNADGELGDASVVQRTTPVVVSGLSAVTSIDLGDAHSCALLGDGTVRCWGNNDHGQIGDGTIVDRSTPTPVLGLSSVASLSAGVQFSCAASPNGTARCWGNNTFGTIGDATNTERHTPVLVSGASVLRALSANGSHTCAVVSDGTARCWGRNSRGQLGNGTIVDSSTPVTVSGLSDVVH